MADQKYDEVITPLLAEVEARMAQLGVSRQQLAERMACSKSLITNILNRHTLPSDGTMNGILEALDMRYRVETRRIVIIMDWAERLVEYMNGPDGE